MQQKQNHREDTPRWERSSSTGGERQNSLFESAPVGLYRIGPDGEILHANDALADILGYRDRAAMRQVNLESLCVDTEQRARERALLQRERVVRGFEMQLRHRDGHVIWVRDSARAVRSPDGRVIYYEGSLEDVTEQKRAAEALRESRERYRTVFETTGTATAILEEDTTISLVNAEYERLSGFSKEEVEGKMSWTDTVAPEDVERMLQRHRQRRRDPDSVPSQYEFRFIDREGTNKDVLAHVDLIPGTGKTVASLLDVTERKRAQHELRERSKYIEALLEVDRAISSTLDLDRVLDLVLDRLQAVVPYDSASLFLLTEGTVRLAAARGRSSRRPRRQTAPHSDENLLADWMRNQEQPLVVADTQADKRLRRPGRSDRPRSSIGIPLLAEGEAVGFMTVHHQEPQAYDEESTAKAEGFARQAAIAIHNAQLYEQAQREIAQRERAEAEKEATIQELRLINETIVEVSRMEDVDGICSLIAKAVHRVNPDAYVFVSLYDPDEDGIRLRAYEGLGDKMDRILRLMGGRPERLTFSPGQMDEATELFTTGKMEHVPGGIYAVAGGLLPRLVSRAVERILGVDRVYTVGFALGDEPRGGIILLPPAGEKVAYRSAIETIASQVSVMIQRRQTEEALRRSQALLSTTQRLTKVGGWAYDVDLDSMHWTEEMYRILGVQPEGFDPGSGKQLARLFTFFDPEDRPVIQKAFERCILEAEPYDLKIPLKTAAGRRLWIRAVGTPVERGGRVVKTIGTIMDITEQRTIEDRLRRQERLAAVGQLAGGIAHDFNNILASIILYAQMALRRDLTPDTRTALETILDESHRAADLIDQILDFSRSSVIETEPVNLTDLVQETVALFHRTIPESVRLVTELSCQQCTIAGDATRIHQMLMNLAINAKDAMPDGGELRIEVEHVTVDPDAERPVLPDVPPGSWARLTVSDTGTGMKREVQEHLFEPFFTTKKEGKGTGLGLAQVYGIVKQHQGFIDVDTSPGEGTAFTIHLPLAVGRSQPDDSGTGERQVLGNGQTILVVEDAQQVLEAVRLGLESVGYRVVTARNGQQALEELSRHGVDLVLTDMVMPEMNGQELLEALKTRAPHLKAVAMTGYVMDTDMAGLREAGFVEALSKPFSIEELTRVVGEVIES